MLKYFQAFPSTKPQGSTILAVICEKFDSHVSSVLIFLCNFDCKMQVGPSLPLEMLLGPGLGAHSEHYEQEGCDAGCMSLYSERELGIERKSKGGKICIRNKDFRSNILRTITPQNCLNNSRNALRKIHFPVQRTSSVRQKYTHFSSQQF